MIWMKFVHNQAGKEERAVRFERILGLGLAGLGLVHVFLFGLVMVPTSLWVDEISSIRDYSAQGVWATLSRYSAPNNHILFNALQALSPFRGSYDPLAARCLSVICAATGLMLSGLFFWRRRRYLEAGVVVLLLGACLELWAALFHARGYGLQFLLVTIVAWAAWDFDSRPSKLRRWVLGGAITMAIWTAPSALLVLGPAAILTFWNSTRKRELLQTGIGITLALLLVHLPLIDEFWHVYTHYAHGRMFEDWEAVRNVSKILFGPTPLMVVIGISFAALGLAAWSKGREGASSACTWILATMAGILLARLLGTPPPRVFAPYAAVFLIAIIWSVGEFIRQVPIQRARYLLSLILTGSLFVFLPHIRAVGEFRYVPIEDWKGVVGFITRAFPPGTSVWAPHRPGLLRIYLPDDYPIVTELSLDAFENGEQIAVDSLLEAGPRMSPAKFTSRTRTVIIPQIRRRYQAVFFEEGTVPVRPTSLRDQEGVFFRQPLENTRPHAFILVGTALTLDQARRGYVVEHDGSLTSLRNAVWFYEGAVIVPLRRNIAAIWMPHMTSQSWENTGNEAWYTWSRLRDSELPM